MRSLREALERVANRHKTITVYSTTPHPELAAQFGTRNATVVHRPLPPGYDRGFVVVTEGDEYVGSMSVEELEALTRPPVAPPWERDLGLGRLYDLLDDTLFATFDRRQMLATAREIEDRAWRTGWGTLYAGFQRPAALSAQVGVYEQLVIRTRLDVHVLVRADWSPPPVAGATVHAESADEVGQFWLVCFDGGGDDFRKCALLAEERSPGVYYGFWTYEPDLVDELLTYLRETYVEGNSWRW